MGWPDDDFGGVFEFEPDGGSAPLPPTAPPQSAAQGIRVGAVSAPPALSSRTATSTQSAVSAAQGLRVGAVSAPPGSGAPNADSASAAAASHGNGTPPLSPEEDDRDPAQVAAGGAGTAPGSAYTTEVPPRLHLDPLAQRPLGSSSKSPPSAYRVKTAVTKQQQGPDGRPHPVQIGF